MKLALGIILTLLAIAASWLAIASIFAIFSLSGKSPGMGFSVLLPLAVVFGGVAVGLGLGAVIAWRGWCRRDRSR